MATPSSSSSFPRLPSAEGPEAGECPSPSGGHSPASSGASPVSVLGQHGEMLQEGGTSPPPVPVAPLEESGEDFQGAMMLASGQYRPKDWVTDPLPETPPPGTVSR